MKTPLSLLSTAGTTGRSEVSLDMTQRHLNHGSYGAVPSRTVEFQARLKSELESNPFRWFEDVAPRHSAARELLASFVGAPASELAMVANASAAASVVFASVTLKPGEEVLISDHVYGAVAMGAARWAAYAGATVRTLPLPLAASSVETLSTIMDAITARTRMIIIDHISSATARHFPAHELANTLASSPATADIVVVVDGAHALGIVEKAAVRAPNTVWFGNLHKYACAPRGSAVLVAQGELAQRLFPTIDSWGAELAYPDRFDLQGSIDTTGFLSAPHAIETIDTLFGWPVVRDYSAQLGAWAQSLIAEAFAPLMLESPIPDVGMPVATQPLLRLPRGVAADGPSARSLKDALATEANCEVGISTWNGTGFMRISAHFYNEAADYEHFVEHGVPVIARLSR